MFEKREASLKECGRAQVPSGMEGAAISFPSTDTLDVSSAILDHKPTGEAMKCRPNCAACCIAPSISSPIPGMPHGKPAGAPCVQLDDALRCKIFGSPLRPTVCGSLRPSPEMCGATRAEAMAGLELLERETAPAQHSLI